jgi:sn-glycerol 3-phosphate transport system permease protein
LSTLLTGRTALATGRSRFVCLDNFTGLLSDTPYHYSVIITFIIAAAIIIIGLSVSLLIAYMAYQPIRGAGVYRTLLVWPYAISPVVAGIMFGIMFDVELGLVNRILGFVGIEIPWKTSQFWAVVAVILTSVWRTMSFNILFYIAGLQNIPGDLIEAASIDGANVVQRFWRITIPLLSPITFFLIITNLTYSFFDIFGTIDYLTGGGPLDATNVMIYNIYELQGTTTGLGRGAAQSIVLFLMVIGLTLLQFRSTGRRVTYGA